jgi:hypothetical protein
MLLTPVFGWLLCEPLSIIGHPKAMMYFIFLFFLLNFPPSNDYMASPTHILPQSHLFYDDPLTADTNFWLVVAFNIRTAAT